MTSDEVGTQHPEEPLALAGGTWFAINFYAVNLWITGLHSYAGV